MSWSEKRKRKVSKKMKERWEDPAFRKRQSDSRIGFWTEERRQEQSKRSIELWKDPASRKRLSDSWTEERRQEHSERCKEGWTEEKRLEKSNRMKELWKDSEYRETHGRKTNGLETVIAKFKEIHGDRYDYSKVDYRGSSEKVTIICKEHGEFEQFANNHTRGRGCSDCSKDEYRGRKRGKNGKTHSFSHPSHGDFTGTIRDFSKKFPISEGSVFALTSGKLKKSKGWVLGDVR